MRGLTVVCGECGTPFVKGSHQREKWCSYACSQIQHARKMKLKRTMKILARLRGPDSSKKPGTV